MTTLWRAATVPRGAFRLASVTCHASSMPCTRRLHAYAAGSAVLRSLVAQHTHHTRRHPLTAVPTRSLSAQAASNTATAAPGSGAGSEQGSAGTGGQGDVPPGAEEAAYGEAAMDEPLVAKLSRWVWFSVKFAFGAGLVAIILYAGYTIVITLLPAGAGSNAIMRRATDMLRHDPEVSSYFGALKTYGEGGGEGRRTFVPEYIYVDDLTDVKYHRVRFRLEGERGQKAMVFAEVREGTYDFRYLIAVTPDMSHVWSVLDNRPPERSLEERQADVSTLLQDGRVTFYADSEVDITEQSHALGSYWLKVPVVRCDVDAARCDGDGVTSRPAWRMKRDNVSMWTTASATVSSWWAQATGGASDGTTLPSAALVHYRISKGVKSLDDLEAMTKSLRKKREAELEQGMLARVRRTLGL